MLHLNATLNTSNTRQILVQNWNMENLLLSVHMHIAQSIDFDGTRHKPYNFFALPTMTLFQFSKIQSIFLNFFLHIICFCKWSITFLDLWNPITKLLLCKYRRVLRIYWVLTRESIGSSNIALSYSFLVE